MGLSGWSISRVAKVTLGTPVCPEILRVVIYIFFGVFRLRASAASRNNMPLGVEREPRGSHTRFLFVFFFYSFGGG